MTSSAIRKQLRGLREQEMVDIAKLPMRTMLWRVLVEPVKAKEETTGGLIKASQTIDAENITTCVGRVLQLGCFAFKSKTTAGLNLADEVNLPKVGDYVLFEQYAGQEVNLKGGRLLRLINDTEVLMLVDEPEAILGYR